jgi:Tfp pilus assembly protein PilF
LLSARRLAVIMAGGTKAEAAALLAKAEVRLFKGDRVGARQALEQATAADESSVAAHIALANLYESVSEWDLAIDRYRRVLAKDPNHTVALNNLAYALAVEKHDPNAAVPMAKRAFALAMGDATIADTLAWVYHLVGNDSEAEALITAAARQQPDIVDIRLHAAFILAATGNADSAAQHLKAAISLDGKLDERADVQELGKRLGVLK